MLQGEHSAILSTFIKLPFDIRIFVCLFLVAILHRFYCISKNNLQSVWSSPFGSTSSAGFNISKMLILGFKPEYDKTLQLLHQHELSLSRLSTSWDINTVG